MKGARVAIVVIGIVLPFISRIPGAALHGIGWISTYLGGGIGGLAIASAFDAVNWGAMLAGTLLYRKVASVLVLACFGFALPAAMHASLDPSADAQSGIARVLIPIYSLPFVAVGWLAGFALDRKILGSADEAQGRQYSLFTLLAVIGSIAFFCGVVATFCAK